jgi:manganese/zinc/iron transport system substrate-binding protein
MLRRLFFCIYILLFVFFSSCSTDYQASIDTATGKHKILATTGMIADLVQQIGGEHIEVMVLIPAALDPHSYELVKGDDEKFAQAKLLFYNGLGLEHGMSMRRHIKAYGEKAICVTSSLQKMDPSPLLKVDGVFDPHVWMDISLWSATVTPICDALSATFPEHASYFLQKKEQVQEAMERADYNAYKKLQAVSQEKRFLVTSHDAFNYFTRRYLREGDENDWTKRCKAPEGLAPEAELCSVDLLEVLCYIQDHGIHVLFTESNLSAQGVRKVLDAGSKRGLSIRLARRPLYADSMGEASSYLEMVQNNVDVIAEELDK